DHLLLLLGNVVPLWETMLAAMKLGVVVIPATTLLTPDELRDRLDSGKARAVVATQDQVAKLAGLGSDGLVRVVVGATAKQEGWLPFEDAANAPEPFTPDGPTKADDPMLLYFTSGTTAKPKLVRHSQRSYPVGHLTTMYWLGLQPGDIHLNISSPGRPRTLARWGGRSRGKGVRLPDAQAKAVHGAGVTWGQGPDGPRARSTAIEAEMGNFAAGTAISIAVATWCLPTMRAT